ncbi:hypothetical protein [Sulfidibacter corallicola]|uniref:Lipoprotein n=1 Tax=Sulfidibacter corallicola TaxID=2818388 RepID=A0A8A4TGC7_SULCO|nr:hypothetical protein [Sulfidibacter corallicola]QTD48610.1 hypothetical protein J3U87_23770 [Sulfidibacter corallicola]
MKVIFSMLLKIKAILLLASLSCTQGDYRLYYPALKFSTRTNTLLSNVKISINNSEFKLGYVGPGKSSTIIDSIELSDIVNVEFDEGCIKYYLNSRVFSHPREPINKSALMIIITSDYKASNALSLMDSDVEFECLSWRDGELYYLNENDLRPVKNYTS